MTADDREEMKAAMSLDWTTPEYLANLAAEELGRALNARGINFSTCFGDEDGVSLGLKGIPQAEAMLTLAVPGGTVAGTLYDRATGCCVMLATLAEQYGDDAPEELVEAAFAEGWVWIIHPDMKGHTPGWHVTVTLPTADANAVTARLNALPFLDDTK